MPDPDSAILDPAFLRLLERLSLVSKRAYAGSAAGARRSPKRGTSVEFADYRGYVAGDDLRRVDWNVYGRLDRLLLKLYVEEEDLRVSLLLDCSRSMAFGAPTKFWFGQRLCAALAYLALNGHDRLVVAGFGTDAPSALPPLRGRGSASRVVAYLSRLAASGATEINCSLVEFAHRHRQPGLCVVVSDFLDPDGYAAGLRALLARRHDVVAIQVLSPEELSPALAGDVELVDAETGERREITVSESLLRAYRNAAASHCEDLRQFCLTRGMGYVLATSDQAMEDLLLTTLRRMGFVR